MLCCSLEGCAEIRSYHAAGRLIRQSMGGANKALLNQCMLCACCMFWFGRGQDSLRSRCVASLYSSTWAWCCSYFPAALRALLTFQVSAVVYILKGKVDWVASSQNSSIWLWHSRVVWKYESILNLLLFTHQKDSMRRWVLQETLCKIWTLLLFV